MFVNLSIFSTDLVPFVLPLAFRSESRVRLEDLETCLIERLDDEFPYF